MAPAEVDPYADRQSQNAVLDRVREATDHEIGDSENAGPLRERERECMTEREDYEDCLAGDFDTCIAAIRADLGVTEPVTAEILPIPPARLIRSSRPPHSGGGLKTTQTCSLSRSGEGDLQATACERDGGISPRPPPSPEHHPPPRG